LEFIYGLFLSYGITILWSPIDGVAGPSIHDFMQCGATIGIFLSILYMGRYYYLSVFKKALFLPGKEKIEKSAVWGFRVFIIFIGFFIVQLVSIGIDWQLSLIYTSMVVIIFLVMSRIFAESGMFFIQIAFMPSAIIWGLFGLKVLGPEITLMLALVSMILLQDPREALMPYIVNSFKLLEIQKVKISRIAFWCIVALVIGLAIAIPINIYINYDQGYKQANDAWAFQTPKFAFRDAVNVTQRLKAQGVLEESKNISGWKRFLKMEPYPSGLIGFGAGLLLVLLFTAARLRFPRWPIHPIIFVAWWGYASWNFYFSFLLGWAIKAAVTKYGGAKIYQKLKPFMVGLISGEVLMALLPVLVGAIYYFITGNPPKQFWVLPA